MVMCDGSLEQQVLARHFSFLITVTAISRALEMF